MDVLTLTRVPGLFQLDTAFLDGFNERLVLLLRRHAVSDDRDEVRLRQGLSLQLTVDQRLEDLGFEVRANRGSATGLPGHVFHNVLNPQGTEFVRVVHVLVDEPQLNAVALGEDARSNPRDSFDQLNLGIPTTVAHHRATVVYRVS